MPEEENYEQYINARYLEKSGAGEAVKMNRIPTGRLRHFMDRLDLFRSRIDRKRLYGKPSAPVPDFCRHFRCNASNL